jgi:hypothetical protein
VIAPSPHPESQSNRRTVFLNQGFKFVSFAISDGTTKRGPSHPTAPQEAPLGDILTLHDNAHWYPDVPAPRVKFAGIGPRGVHHSQYGRPLFTAMPAGGLVEGLDVHDFPRVSGIAIKLVSGGPRIREITVSWISPKGGIHTANIGKRYRVVSEVKEYSLTLDPNNERITRFAAHYLPSGELVYLKVTSLAPWDLVTREKWNYANLWFSLLVQISTSFGRMVELPPLSNVHDSWPTETIILKNSDKVIGIIAREASRHRPATREMDDANAINAG